MTMRKIGFISLLLNIGLLGAAAYVYKQPSGNSTLPPAEAGIQKHAAAKKSPSASTLERSILTTSDAEPPAGQFSWALLEARDYKTYIANLRAVECPEETIRD